MLADYKMDYNYQLVIILFYKISAIFCIFFLYLYCKCSLRFTLVSFERVDLEA